MPVTYQLDQESSFIHTRCTGEVTLEEVIRHFQELETDPLLPARLDVLLDLSEMQSLPESDQLRSVAGEIGRLEPKVEWGACAIVASHDALFGMIRVFEVFAEGLFADLRVFRKRAEAELWLASVRTR